MKKVLLAIFGFVLLAGAAAAQSDYRIKSGDTIAVEVLEDQQLNRSLLVLPDGTVNFPFAGTIRAGGQTVDEVRQAIASGIAGNFASPPTVFVTVSGLRPEPPPVAGAAGVAATGPVIGIYFLGEVKTPGRQAVAPGTTFLQAVALSGGFTPFAATKRIQLRRTVEGVPKVYSINYRALSNGAALAQDIVLQEGDVILTPERRLFE